MINYNLARRLKDAGFPQKQPNFYPNDGVNVAMYLPTLSELIEACGDEFESLKKFTGINFSGWIVNEEGWGLEGGYLGKTPEEAVSNLWLELNKK